LGYSDTGKRIYKRKSGFRTRMEALDYIPTMRQERIEASSDKTVEECFESACGRFEGSERTLKIYGYSFKRRFAMLADYPVRYIQPMDWQRIIDSMKQEGLSHAYRAQALQIIHMIDRQAVLEGIIPSPRSSAVAAGKLDRKVYHVALTPEEIQRHRNLADEGDETAMIACILIMTGMRVNELLTLPTASYNREGKYLVGGLKTASGRNRVIPLASACVPYVDHFADKGNALLIGFGYSTLKRRLPVFYQEHGWPVHTAHDYRRTFATQMKTVSAPESDKLAIIGHANIEMTQYYQDSRAEELRKIVDQMW